MSQAVFQALSDKIENGLHALANYQFVMLRHVLINGKSSKTAICISLGRANEGAPKSFVNCPVFKVLVNKKQSDPVRMTRTKENNEYYYNLAICEQLTTAEKDDLVIIAQSAKLRYDKK